MPDRVRALRQVLLVILGFALVGVLAGAVWEWVWTPPTGVALGKEFLLDGDGLRSDFSSTALYVVVASLAGLLLGVLVAVLARRHELLTLVAVAVGSVLAAWLMLRVGVLLGPPDPGRWPGRPRTTRPSSTQLQVSGRSPFVAFPGGALVGLLVAFVGLNGRSSTAD